MLPEFFERLPTREEVGNQIFEAVRKSRRLRSLYRLETDRDAQQSVKKAVLANERQLTVERLARSTGSLTGSEMQEAQNNVS